MEIPCTQETDRRGALPNILFNLRDWRLGVICVDGKGPPSLSKLLGCRIHCVDAEFQQQSRRLPTTMDLRDCDPRPGPTSGALTNQVRWLLYDVRMAVVQPVDATHSNKYEL